jgi:hypothetical protein
MKRGSVVEEEDNGGRRGRSGKMVVNGGDQGPTVQHNRRSKVLIG